MTIEQDIIELDVPMDDAGLLMKIDNCECQLVENEPGDLFDLAQLLIG